MFCPACGVENTGATLRFCRSCGADLRAVSQTLNKSVPMKLASTLDAYLENRFQRNLGNGVLNLIAFVALMAVGSWHLISGWTIFGGLMLGLGVLSLFLGVWDIWIYKRNLPPVAKQSPLPSKATTNGLTSHRSELSLSSVVPEPTTKRLDVRNEPQGRDV